MGRTILDRAAFNSGLERAAKYHDREAEIMLDANKKAKNTYAAFEYAVHKLSAQDIRKLKK